MVEEKPTERGGEREKRGVYSERFASTMIIAAYELHPFRQLVGICPPMAFDQQRSSHVPILRIPAASVCERNRGVCPVGDDEGEAILQASCQAVD